MLFQKTKCVLLPLSLSLSRQNFPNKQANKKRKVRFFTTRSVWVLIDLTLIMTVNVKSNKTLSRGGLVFLFWVGGSDRSINGGGSGGGTIGWLVFALFC